MTGTHLRAFLIGGLLVGLTLSGLAFSDEDYSDDDYLQDSSPSDVEKVRVLRPRSLASTSDPSFRTARYSSSNEPSRFSFGVFVGWDLSVSASDQLQETQGSNHVEGDGHEHGLLGRGVTSKCPLGTRCHAGEDHSVSILDGSGGVSGGSLPVITLKGGYRLTQGLSLSASIPIDLAGGVRDLAIGPNLSFRLSPSFLANLSLTATAPISTASREEGKLTTITLALNTLWLSRGGKYFAGAGLYGSGIVYRPGPEGTASTSRGVAKIRAHIETQSGQDHDEHDGTELLSSTSGIGELVRTGVSTYAGLSLTDNLSANVSFGAGTVYLTEGPLNFVTDATLARVAYSSSGFMGAVGFSLLSDPKGTPNFTLPTQPYVGFKLQYVFGRLSTLGIVGTDSLSEH